MHTTPYEGKMGFLIPRELTDRVETFIYLFIFNVKVDLYVVVVETGYSSGEQTNTDN